MDINDFVYNVGAVQYGLVCRAAGVLLIVLAVRGLIRACSARPSAYKPFEDFED